MFSPGNYQKQDYFSQLCFAVTKRTDKNKVEDESLFGLREFKVQSMVGQLHPFGHKVTQAGHHGRRVWQRKAAQDMAPGSRESKLHSPGIRYILQRHISSDLLQPPYLPTVTNQLNRISGLIH